MKIRNIRKRKAISPVLATVILIAITLIAAIAIAGFVFGLFSGFTSSATVLVTSTNLTHAAAAAEPTGTIVASNTGTASATINTLTLTYGGNTCTPAVIAYAPASGQVVAGSTNTITLAAGACAGAPAGVSGEAFTGSLSLSNGGQIAFSGSFS